MEPNAAEPVVHAVPEPAEPHLELLPGPEPVETAEPAAEAEADADEDEEAEEVRTRPPRSSSRRPRIR